MNSSIAKWVDLPPVWLCLFLALAWVQSSNLGIFQGAPAIIDLLGGLGVGAGVLLIALAAVELRRARTTIIPHQPPEALVTTGIYRRTRNPVYLGDTLILTGLILRWEAWPSLLLVPLFVWVITDRFILGEEGRLVDAFGPAFDRYAQGTRRWL